MSHKTTRPLQIPWYCSFNEHAEQHAAFPLHKPQRRRDIHHVLALPDTRGLVNSGRWFNTCVCVWVFTVCSVNSLPQAASVTSPLLCVCMCVYVCVCVCVCVLTHYLRQPQWPSLSWLSQSSLLLLQPSSAQVSISHLKRATFLFVVQRVIYIIFCSWTFTQ